MLVIQFVRLVRRLPIVMLLGLAVMALGGVLDVVVHLTSSDHHAHAGFAAEHAAHLVGIAGMAIVLAGLVAHGAHRSRRPLSGGHGGLDSNAHR